MKSSATSEQSASRKRFLLPLAFLACALLAAGVMWTAPHSQSAAWAETGGGSLYASSLGKATAAGLIAQDGDENPHGECGDGLSWSFDPDTGTLTIAHDGVGTGTMTNWTSTLKAPWDDLRSSTTSVVIGPGVINIGNLSFQNCAALESLSIGGDVTAIGACAFQNCTSLNTVSISDSVSSIGDETFEGCTGLRLAEIGTGVRMIGTSAFGGCEALLTLTFKDGSHMGSSEAGAFGTRAFNGCTALATVNSTSKNVYLYFRDYFASVEHSVTQTLPIDEASQLAYAYNEDVTGTWLIGLGNADWNVVVPTTMGGTAENPNTSRPVVGIADSAFLNKTGLRSIAFEEGTQIKTIEASAFKGCISLLEFRVPSTVTSIGSEAFCNCYEIRTVELNAAGAQLASIGEKAFYNCQRLGKGVGDSPAKLDLPLTVSSIGEKAFSGEAPFSGVGTVAFPNGSSVLEVTKNMFHGCQHVTLGEGTESIGDQGFSGCTTIESVTLPSTLTSIGARGFNGCSKLASPQIPTTVSSIGASAFSGCSSITEISLGDNSNLIVIGDSAFSGCSKLEQITLPYGLTNIGANLFSGCRALQEFWVPQQVTYIGDKAFYNCAALTTITVPNGAAYTSIGASAFEGCKLLEQADIPATVTAIGDRAYYGCTALATLNIGENSALKTIGNSAFAGCAALGSTLALPDQITSIGGDAFSGCSALEFLTLNSDRTELGYHCFWGIANPSCIYVVTSSMFEMLVESESFIDNTKTEAVLIGGTIHDIASAYKDGTLTIDVAQSSYNTEGARPAVTVKYDGVALLEDTDYTLTFETPVHAGEGVVLVKGKGNYVGFARKTYTVDKAIIDVPAPVEGLKYNGSAQVGVPAHGNGRYTVKNGSAANAGTYTATLSIADKENYTWSDETTEDKTVDWSIAQVGVTVTPANASKVYGDSDPAFTATLVAKVPADQPLVDSDASKIRYTLARNAGENKGDYTITATGNADQGNYAVEFGTATLSISACDLSGAEITLETDNYAYSGTGATPKVATIKINGKTRTLVEDTDYDLTYEHNVDPGNAGDANGPKAIITGKGNYTGVVVKGFSITAAAKCGDNLTWTFNPDTGALSISGTGAMFDWGRASNVPWYDNRNSIKNVTIGEGVTSIGNRAFLGCSALETTSIGADVATIGDYAFQTCESLATVSFAHGSQMGSPDQAFGTKAFDGCSKLATVSSTSKNVYLYFLDSFAGEVQQPDIPVDATAHLRYAYSEGATSAWILSPSEAIADEVNVVVPATVGSDCPVVGIARNAFAGQTGIHGVAFAEGSQLTTIEASAFKGCISIKKMSIPATVATIGDDAFSSCDILDEVQFADSAALVSVGARAFFNCPKLEQIELPAAVSTIGNYAFSHDSNSPNGGVKAVSFHGGNSALTEVARYMFHGCQSVALGEGTQRIGDSAFYGCTALASISLPSTLTEIGNSSFSGCNSLAFPTIPASVTSIGNSAFSGCSAFTTALLASNTSLTSIGSSAFSSCTNLEQVALPENLTQLGSSAFSSCTKLEQASLPDGLTQISDKLFSNCRALTVIRIPQSALSIGSEAFLNCTALTTATVPESAQFTTIGGSAFEGCSQLQAIDIPSTVTGIDDEAFYKCSALVAVNFRPTATLTAIGKSAFRQCTSLAAIDLPATLATVDEYAFDGCTALETIKLNSDNAVLYRQCFMDLANPSLIYVVSDIMYSQLTGDQGFLDNEKTSIYRVGSSMHDISKANTTDTITIEIGEAVYGTESARPEVTVTFNGAKLTEDTDYTVTYETAMHAGEAVVLVKGMGGYVGFRRATYTVDQAKITIPEAPSNLKYNGSEQVGVPEHESGKYTIKSGSTVKATKAGTYTATLTLADKENYTWSDKTTEDKTIGWSIAQVGVMVQPENKSMVFGDNAPTLTASLVAKSPDDQALVNSETSKIRYTLTRETGTNVGDYEITATGNTNQGNYAVEFGTATLSISARSLPANCITVSPSSCVYSGAVQTPSVTVQVNRRTLVKGTDYELSYANNKDVGTAKALVTGKGNYLGSAEKEFTIIGKTVTVTPKSATKEFGDPDPAFTATVTGTVSGDESTIVYGFSRDDAGTVEGEARGSHTFAATGEKVQGGYTVTFKTATLTITQKALPSGCVTLDQTEYAYDGTAKKPGVTVKVGNKTLVKDTDYTLSYSNNTNPSTASSPAVVKVTGKGNYKGSASATFTITQNLDGATVTLSKSTYTYTGKAAEPTATVKVGSKRLVEGADYTVSYKNNVNAGTATVVVNGLGATPGVAEKTFTIKPVAVTVTPDAATKTYGDADPAFTATVKGAPDGTASEVKYTLSRTAGEKPGSYTITASGTSDQGNFTVRFGTARLTIQKRSLAGATVKTAKAKYVCKGSALKPSVTVTLNGKKLKANTDYTLSYSNNFNAGTATVTVRGAGGYKDSAAGKFKIVGLAPGRTTTVKGATYQVKSTKSVYFTKAPTSKKKVTIPATVKIKGKRYKVTGIASNAFSGAKAKTVIVKTKKLTKKRTKNCLMNSKIKTVKVPKAKKKAYKKVFAKKNSGKKVKVK